MESVRRLLAHSYREKKKEEEGGPLQMVIAFSLEKSGMANLELELLPFLLDLLKNHFPGMVGAVFILHYGWVHAGMWGLAKRVLPQQALDKIFFPSKDGLLEFFDADHLPRPFGGTLDVEIDESSNDVMSKFARPVFSSKKKAGQDEGKAAEGGGGSANAGGDSSSDESWERNSAPPSPRGRSGVSSPALGYKKTLSRSGSFDSLVDEFYSTENTVSLALHYACKLCYCITMAADPPLSFAALGLAQRHTKALGALYASAGADAAPRRRPAQHDAQGRSEAAILANDAGRGGLSLF